MAQLSQNELEQIQSFLAQQGVVFQPTSTDATKREVIYAAVNQLTRNPAQTFEIPIGFLSSKSSHT